MRWSASSSTRYRTGFNNTLCLSLALIATAAYFDEITTAIFSAFYETGGRRRIFGGANP